MIFFCHSFIYLLLFFFIFPTYEDVYEVRALRCLCSVSSYVRTPCNNVSTLRPDGAYITWVNYALPLVHAISCQLFNLNQCWHENKLQWDLNENMIVSCQENGLENIVCEMAAILFRLQTVKWHPGGCITDDSVNYSKCPCMPTWLCPEIQSRCCFKAVTYGIEGIRLS